jgi:hypothetical protein
VTDAKVPQGAAGFAFTFFDTVTPGPESLNAPSPDRKQVHRHRNPGSALENPPWGVVESVPDVATLIPATLTGALEAGASIAPDRLAIAEDPNAKRDSESRKRDKPW